MSPFRRASIISCAVLATSSLASADVLEGFNLTGDGLVTSAQLPLTATTFDPNVIAGPLNVSANFSPGAVQIPAYVGPDAVATDTGANPVYIDFSVTPAAGYTMSVSALDADVVIQNPNIVNILESTDGTFANATQVATVATAGSWTGSATTFSLSSVAALQNIPSGETTTFFVEIPSSAYNDVGINEKSSTFQDGDALDIVGATAAATPEPASIGLLVGGVTLFLSRRRGR